MADSTRSTDTAAPRPIRLAVKTTSAERPNAWASAVPSLPPIPLTPLIGRERELATTIDLLTRPEIRLLSLIGPGGMGKTRLALRVAEDLTAEFPDGVTFVDLAPLDDSALVMPTIALELGLRIDLASPRAALDQLVRSIRHERLLLILDNWERLVDAAPSLTTLLAACRDVKVLATSRTALNVRGEQQFPLPPLPLPERDADGNARLPSLSELEAIPSVALFVARAQAVDHAFALDQTNAAAVAELCIRLDGLPLAIELAAAWCNLLPPAALLERFGRPLDLLTTGPRDLPDRQRALRATIAWSDDLLSPSQRTLFRRLAVFSGGFTPEAASSVAETEGRRDGGTALRPSVLVDLAALHEQSLIRRMVESVEPRFGMLETIREYAADQLAASGEIEAVRDAHATYFVALAESSFDLLASAEPDATHAIGRLATNMPNLRAAETWLRERGDVERAARLNDVIARTLTEERPEHAPLPGDDAPMSKIGAAEPVATAAPEPAASPDSTTADPAPLTPRELGVLRLLVEGKSDREIADELAISRRTASNHVAAILAKLRAPSRTAAATRAVRDGLV